MAERFEGDAELLHPSDYVRAADLQGRDVTMTIDHVMKDEELVMKGGVKDKKPIVYFKETPKKLVLNKTNKATIVSLYGNTVKGWTGKRVTLHEATTSAGGKEVRCIRIRDTKPAAAAKETAA